MTSFAFHQRMQSSACVDGGDTHIGFLRMNDKELVCIMLKLPDWPSEVAHTFNLGLTFNWEAKVGESQ